MEHETDAEWARRFAIESVQREIAEMERRDALPPRRSRRKPRTPGEQSIVYSIRLDRAEIELLEQQADERGLRPSAYARNLIRSTLAARQNDELADALDRLQQVLDEVQSLVRPPFPGPIPTL
jgi:hypothetical protein